MDQKHTRIAVLILGSLLLVSCKTSMQEKAQESVLPPEKSLRQLVTEKFPQNPFLVGVTCGLWAYDYPWGDIVDAEFGYLTPENDFKQKVLHPNNTSWNFTNADLWIAHAAAHNQVIRMHCPIGPQVSDWAEDDSRTAEEMETNLTEFLTKVCQRYNGLAPVKYMDVVNETVQNGAWFGPRSGTGQWENPWTILGFDTDTNATPLYIKKAFTIATAHAPNIKLLYNHHEGPEYTASWDRIKETVLSLKASGLRVDAIGWQSHIDNGWATEAHLSALISLIDWAQNHGLEFHVTEASSFIKNAVTPAELTLQADTYAAVFQALLKKTSTGTLGWNTWHLTDAYTYRSEWSPALFDKDYRRKPAYFAIKTSLEEWH